MDLEVDSYISRVNNVTDEVQSEFGSLNAEQLNFRPGPDKWSIAECIDHLNVINNCYYDEFKPVVDGSYRKTFWMRISPFTQVIGSTMVRTLGPDKQKTYKTPRLFEPSKSDIDSDVIDRFKQNQEELVSYLEMFKDVDNNVIINSPVSTVITLKLTDAVKIIVGHEERHLQQAMDVKANPNFPKA